MKYTVKVLPIVVTISLLLSLAGFVSLASATVTASGAANSPQPVPVTLTVEPGGIIMVDKQVGVSSDDCYTFRTRIRLTRTSLFIDNGSYYMHTYLRFTNVNVPRGATIEHAYIDLCSDAHHGGHSYLRIYGIKEANTNTFSTQADADSRPVTDAYVQWAMNGLYQNQTWLPGTWYGWTNDPHDIKDVIEEIVGQDGWEANNALAIKIVNLRHESNSRTVYSWEYGDHSLAPKLHIEYSAGADTTPPTITCHSPTGAEVATGTIITTTFSEAMNKSSAEAAFSISPSISGSFSWDGNKMIFIPDANLQYNTTYTVIISTDAHDVAGNSLEVPYSWEFTTSPSAPAIAFSPENFNFTATQVGSNPADQTFGIYNSGGGTLNWSVTDDAGWLSLNPTSGSSTGQTGNITLSVDTTGLPANTYTATITITASGAANSPQTVPVTLTVKPGGIVTVDKQVRASSDDCYTFRTTIRLTRTCLFIDECSNYMHAYMRFTDVTIPRGATIEHAYIDLCSDAYHGGRSYLRIYGVKETNTNTFSTQADADSRPVTDAYVEWTMNGLHQNQTWLPGTWYGWTNDPHDIKDVIQEIVGQDGWEANNALAIKIVNTVHESSARCVYSWDYGNHSLAPKLHIEYSAGADTTPPTITSHSPTGTEVATGTAITATFSEAMNKSSAEAAFSISPSVSGSFSWDGNKMVFIPDANLQYNMTYTVIISTDAQDPAGNSLEVPYSWEFTTSPSPPAIAFSPEKFNFTATEAGSNPAGQTLGIYNSGGGTLSWSITDDADWLSLNPSSGSSTGETDNITLSVDTTGLSANTCTATITITASGAANSPQTVPVTLTVEPGEVIMVDKQVEASSDDCYTFRTTIRLTRNCLFIDECSNYMHAYMRFTDVTIPRGATIEHAYIDLCSDAHHGGRSYLRIYGIKEANTNTFSTQADADGRPVTDAYVEWTMNGLHQNQTWLPGTWYGWTNDPHDIKDVIQEIVGQDGWEANNALAIKIVNTVHESNARRVCSWDYGNHSLAPKLHIEYSLGADASPVVM